MPTHADLRDFLSQRAETLIFTAPTVAMDAAIAYGMLRGAAGCRLPVPEWRVPDTGVIQLEWRREGATLTLVVGDAGAVVVILGLDAETISEDWPAGEPLPASVAEVLIFFCDEDGR